VSRDKASSRFSPEFKGSAWAYSVDFMQHSEAFCDWCINCRLMFALDKVGVFLQIYLLNNIRRVMLEGICGKGVSSLVLSELSKLWKLTRICALVVVIAYPIAPWGLSVLKTGSQL
jgi:hypothetical protein